MRLSDQIWGIWTEVRETFCCDCTPHGCSLEQLLKLTEANILIDIRTSRCSISVTWTPYIYINIYMFYYIHKAEWGNKWH